MRTAGTLLISTSLALAHAAPARADLITVTLDHQLIVTNNDIVIACFEPALTTQPYPSGLLLTNSLKLGFVLTPFSGTVEATVSGNGLPPLPPEPFQTPSLLVDGGLNQLGTLVKRTRIWDMPSYSSSTGELSPASIGQTGDDGEIDIRAIPDGGSGYVGYATSDLTKFGYMQIQRLSLLEWRLVGYRYDDAGAPVLVESLIPAPGTLAAFSLFALPRSRRRAAGASPRTPEDQHLKSGELQRGGKPLCGAD